MLYTSAVTLKPIAGLLAGLLYDPYPPRFTQKVYRLLSEGLPLIARLHPGVRYPMDDVLLHRIVDREGHVIALSGFDRLSDRLLVVDPWDKVRFGGDYGGLYWEYAPIVTGLWMVDSTMDIVLCAFPLPVRLMFSGQEQNEIQITAEVSFTAPEGVTLLARMLENLTVSIQIPEGLTLASSQRRQYREVLLPSEVAQFHWRVMVDKQPVQGEIQVSAAAIAKGIEPYPFTDIVGSATSVAVETYVEEAIHLL